LSTIKDAVTNEILAYQVSQRITLDIATDTIHNLMKKLTPIQYRNQLLIA
jgi:hypothetical protein